MDNIVLSKADSRILASVFDPESALSQASITVDPSLPADPHITSEETLSLLKQREREAIQLIEKQERANVDSKDEAYCQALAILDELIVQNPKYASARNNRAQLRRWRFGDRRALCQLRAAPDSRRSAAALASLDDLSTCIELASPPQQQDPVSSTQCRLLGQAHTQLAAMYYGAAKDLAEEQEFTIEAPRFENFAKAQFDELASHHFYLGGMYGNEVARALAVHTNPHAKLCGSIVQEAIRQELAAGID